MSNELILKDFVVTVTVLGRVKHRFIIRALDVYYAKTKAQDIVIELQELNVEESKHIQYSATLFDDLDKQQIFVCF